MVLTIQNNSLEYMGILTSCFWILLAEVSHKIPNTYTVLSISTLLVIVLSIIHLFALDNTNDLLEPSIPNTSPIASAVTERSYSESPNSRLNPRNKS